MKHLWIIRVVVLSILLYGPTLWAQTLFFVGTTDSDEIESVALIELDEKNETLKIVRKFKAGKRPGYPKYHVVLSWISFWTNRGIEWATFI